MKNSIMLKDNFAFAKIPNATATLQHKTKASSRKLS